MGRKVIYKKFSDKDLIMVSEMNARGMNDGQIANEMGLSRGKVGYNRRNFLESSAARIISQSELDRIRELNGFGYNDGDIGVEIGRSKVAVKRHRKSMELSANPVNTKWTVARRKKDTKEARAERTGGFTNYKTAIDRERSKSILCPGYPLTQGLMMYALSLEGPLQTGDLIDKIIEERKKREWKPYGLGHSNFRSQASVLRQVDLIRSSQGGRNTAIYRLTPLSRKWFRILSDPNTEEIRQLHALGWSDRAMGYKLSKAHTTIGSTRKFLGLEAHKPLSDEDRDEIKRLNSLGWTQERIAYELGINRLTISRNREVLELQDTSNNVTDEERARIRELNTEGYNDQMIAKKLFRDYHTIGRHRRDMELPDVSDSELSRANIVIKRKVTIERDIGEGISYPTMARRLKIANLGWPDNSLSEALVLYSLDKLGEADDEAIRKAYCNKKEDEGWRPYGLTIQSLRGYLAPLKTQGLVEITTSRDVIPTRYKLTGKAYQQLFNFRIGSNKKISEGEARKLMESRLEDRAGESDEFGNDYEDELDADKYFK